MSKPSALFVAAREGNLAVVKSLVKRGESINAITLEGSFPLLIASQRGHLEVVKFLVEKEASIEACTSEGYTSLYVACSFGQLDVVKFLIIRGADIDAPGLDEFTSLMIASQQGHLEVEERGAKLRKTHQAACLSTIKRDGSHDRDKLGWRNPWTQRHLVPRIFAGSSSGEQDEVHFTEEPGPYFGG
ncbi:ankyrin repeat-containing domain protein [Mycena galericulata]|nr:ankyrin repeat-containing domain protein [Mycena galericulata]KAJ7506445.1 ankyrin repeat-containing domain protein [Mycena galericulata]KAJ7509202.1 ankyrin repeat-containing domain protein [Mycena galericulata]